MIATVLAANGAMTNPNNNDASKQPPEGSAQSGTLPRPTSLGSSPSCWAQHLHGGTKRRPDLSARPAALTPTRG